MLRLWGCLVLVWMVAATASAQPAADRGSTPAVRTAVTDPVEASIYYVVERDVTVYTEPDPLSRPYLKLGFREPVFLRERQGAWSRIQTQDGAEGYVPSSMISNVWIRVSKGKKTVFLYRGTELLKTFPADFGYNAFADKRRRGSPTNPDDWRTPEGSFFVVRKNPNSKFYKALVLNYPTAEDAERGLKEGLITREQYEAIVQAEREFRMPPMTTELGGMIEIHGDGTGVGSNWTMGCVAVHNSHMDELWKWVDVGTPVLIEP